MVKWFRFLIAAAAFACLSGSSALADTLSAPPPPSLPPFKASALPPKPPTPPFVLPGGANRSYPDPWHGQTPPAWSRAAGSAPLEPQAQDNALTAAAAPLGTATAGVADDGSGCASWTAGSGDPTQGGTYPTCNQWASDSFVAYSPNGITAFTYAKNAVPFGYARFFVPYDALGHWNGSACDWSAAFRQGGYSTTDSTSGQYVQGRYEVAAQNWVQLIDELAAAKQIGLTPEIVITPGTGIGFGGSYYQGGSGSTALFPDVGSPGHLSTQWYDYACGVYFLEYYIFLEEKALGWSPPFMPSQYEAWNEPDDPAYGLSPYLNGSGAGSGPWKAAYLWYTAQLYSNDLSTVISGFPSLAIAALTMTHPDSNAYLDNYWDALHNTITCQSGYGGLCSNPYAAHLMPGAWAVHDYSDPTIGGTQDLIQFESELARKNAALGYNIDQVWVTESGVRLDLPGDSDANHPNGYPCTGADGAENANTFGCRVDNNGAAQAQGGTTWASLGSVSGGSGQAGVITTMLLWYQFQLQNSPHVFDSALVDTSGVHFRPSYCAITGFPTCDGNVSDYETPGGV